MTRATAAGFSLGVVTLVLPGERFGVHVFVALAEFAAGFCIGAVAAIMGVAGGKLLIPGRALLLVLSSTQAWRVPSPCSVVTTRAAGR